MNVYIIDKGSMAPIPNSEDWNNHSNSLRLIYLTTDADVFNLFAKEKPEAIVTCGNFNYPTLRKLPWAYRGRWIHVAEKKDITVSKIHSCTAGLIFNDEARKPVISVFTTAFASGNRIQRAYRSILNQAHDNWEWVIFDDSLDSNTWDNYLVPLASNDPRVRIYRRNCNDAFIGAVKRDAAMLCRGLYLVELDHDDEFATPEAFRLIAKTFDENPHISLIGSDCCELYENTLANHSYGEHFGRGYHGYYAQWYNGKWINVVRNGPLNGYTARHIVGVYNHVRVFRASVYHEVGGHNANMRVADDYELILRFFCHAYAADSSKPTLARLPELLYIQYRTYNQSNFTIKLNGVIQILTAQTAKHYETKLQTRFEQLGVDDKYALIDNGTARVSDIPHQPFYRTWFAEPSADCVLDPNPNCVSIIMSTYNRPDMCLRAIQSVFAQTYQNWKLYIVGDQCPALDALMDREAIMHNNNKIRYWNMITGGKDGAVPKNYAAKLLVTSNYIAYLDDDNYWKPNHLQTLVDAMSTQPDLSFVYGSFECDGLEIICGEPVQKCRIDTSTMLHLRSLFDEFGYWRTQKNVGYANDWEIVSRWKAAGKKYLATKAVTLIYNNNHMHQNMRGIYELYGDQVPRTEQQWQEYEERIKQQQQQQNEQKKQTCTVNNNNNTVCATPFQKVIDEEPEISVFAF